LNLGCFRGRKGENTKRSLVGNLGLCFRLGGRTGRMERKKKTDGASAERKMASHPQTGVGVFCGREGGVNNKTGICSHSPRGGERSPGKKKGGGELRYRDPEGY